MGKPPLDIVTLRELHEAGQFDQAKEGYLAILRKNPRNAEILHSLGILCAQQDNFPEAIQHLQKALQFQPDNLILHLHLANMQKIQGLHDQAAQTLHAALIIDPHYVAALNNLGTVYYAQGKFSDAIDTYQRALADQPDHIDAYYNLGLALNKQNRIDAAITTYDKLLSLASDHFAARFHLACLLMQQEEWAAAEKHFLTIESTHPYHLETQTNLATCYLKLGSLKQAKLHYGNALELAPEDAQILFNLGVVNMQLGQIDNAIQYYQRVIRINPDLFEAHNNLGVAFLAKEHAAFALHHFQEAFRLEPKNSVIRYTVHRLSKNQRLLAAPPEYITALFDAYADHYEPHLLTALDYQVPTQLQEALLSITQPTLNTWDILDLGCGTGLCGALLKPYARSLIGVDLSEKMLSIAEQKKSYDQLIQSDILTFLPNQQAAYDLIVAGDALVYLSDLDPLFQLVAQALRRDGYFAFNTEISQEKDYQMNQSGRFSHQKNYLEALATTHHLRIAYYQPVITRMQNNEPVHGHLYIMQRLENLS